MRSSPPGPTIRPRRASTVGGIYGSHRDSSALDRGRCRVHVPLIESASGDAAASATGTVTDSVGRWYSDPGDDAGVSRLSHPVVRFVTGDGRTGEFEAQVGSNL